MLLLYNEGHGCVFFVIVNTKIKFRLYPKGHKRAILLINLTSNNRYSEEYSN